MLYYVVIDLVGGLTAKAEANEFLFIEELLQEIYKHSRENSHLLNFNRADILATLQNQKILNQKLDSLLQNHQNHLDTQELLTQTLQLVLTTVETLQADIQRMPVPPRTFGAFRHLDVKK